MNTGFKIIVSNFELKTFFEFEITAVFVRLFFFPVLRTFLVRTQEPFNISKI